ncbi:hypothetical protein V9N52_004225 [Vibrio navarrensis]
MIQNKDWRAISVLLWEYLVASKEQPLLFYSSVAQQMGIHPRHVNYPLIYILEFCERHHLPALSGLVISKDQYQNQGVRKPGSGFRIKHQDQFYFPDSFQFDEYYQRELNQIRATDWTSVRYEPCQLSHSRLKKHLSQQKMRQ